MGGSARALGTVPKRVPTAKHCAKFPSYIHSCLLRHHLGAPAVTASTTLLQRN